MLPSTLDRVLAPAEHEDSSMSNPNRMRSVFTTFCSSHQVRLHRADGRGHRFLADKIVALDDTNPRPAPGLADIFNPWRRFGAVRQGSMRGQLEQVIAKPGLSKDVFETVQRSQWR